MPVLGNLFGTPTRVALGMGEESAAALARGRQAARVPQGARAAEGSKDARQNTRPVFLQVMHMAPKEKKSARVPGDRVGGGRGRSRPVARADVLAGRRRSADHVGADRDVWPAQDAAEPRHLSPAGDRAEQGDHALARAPRRRARLS